MGTAAISVRGISKRYRIGHLRRHRKNLRETLTEAALSPLRRLRSFGRSSHREEDSIWALRDVSFEVEHGEVLGVIGPNGAGKSTLLKVLARVTDPTEGRAVLSGRVGSLLEVGTGFHGELTGRENIYLSGAILGMKRAEIGRKFDAIVDFAGVEPFIDTPIKRYSSGMRVRLGFAVAAHLEPEILLVDEVLAVGDAAFQKKCLGRMESLEQRGRAVVFVSHNMASVQHLCTRCLWLEEGRVAAAGDPVQVVESYLASAGQRVGIPAAGYAFEVQPPEPRPAAWVTGLELLDEEGMPLREPRTWDPLRARIAFQCAEPGRYSLYLSVQTPDGCPLMGIAMEGTDAIQVDCAAGSHRVDCCLPRLALAAGTYHVGAGISIPGRRWLHKVHRVGRLTVAPADVFDSGRPPESGLGALALEHRWETPAGPGLEEIRLR